MRRHLIVFVLSMVAVLAVLTGLAWGVVHLTRLAELAAEPQWTWSWTTGEGLRWAFSWATEVIPLAFLVWVASVCARDRGHPWRPLLVAGAVVTAWTGMAFAMMSTGRYVVTWPGPVTPGYPWAESYVLTVKHPGIAGPVILLVGLGLTAWLAVRRGPGHGAPLPAGSLLGRWVTGVVCGVTVTVLLAATVAAQAALHRSPYLTAIDVWFSSSMLTLVGTTAAAAATAAFVSGHGGWTAVPLALTMLIVVHPPLADWWAGAADWLLLSAVATAGATACAWAWRPAARALDTLVGTSTTNA